MRTCLLGMQVQGPTIMGVLGVMAKRCNCYPSFLTVPAQACACGVAPLVQHSVNQSSQVKAKQACIKHLLICSQLCSTPCAARTPAHPLCTPRPWPGWQPRACSNLQEAFSGMSTTPAARWPRCLHVHTGYCQRMCTSL